MKYFTRLAPPAPHEGSRARQSEVPETSAGGPLEVPLHQSHIGGSTRDCLSHRIQVDSEGDSSKKKQDFKQIGKEKEDEATKETSRRVMTPARVPMDKLEAFKGRTVNPCDDRSINFDLDKMKEDQQNIATKNSSDQDRRGVLQQVIKTTPRNETEEDNKTIEEQVKIKAIKAAQSQPNKNNKNNKNNKLVRSKQAGALASAAPQVSPAQDGNDNFSADTTTADVLAATMRKLTSQNAAIKLAQLQRDRQVLLAQLQEEYAVAGQAADVMAVATEQLQAAADVKEVTPAVATGQQPAADMLQAAVATEVVAADVKEAMTEAVATGQQPHADMLQAAVATEQPHADVLQAAVATEQPHADVLQAAVATEQLTQTWKNRPIFSSLATEPLPAADVLQAAEATEQL